MTGVLRIAGWFALLSRVVVGVLICRLRFVGCI